MAASDANIERIKKRMNYQTIGPDKLNHLRHARFLPDVEAVREQMSKHAAKMRPKFEAVLTVLDRELAELGIARWKKPNGGYFISMFSEKGCAKRIVSLCRDAGLILTSAGATFPYGIDPDDSNIRIAPSFPSPEELTKAAELLCIATRLATLELFTKQ
jgi:DNA-binding transcriptional MocR family regulator